MRKILVIGPDPDTRKTLSIPQLTQNLRHVKVFQSSKSYEEKIGHRVAYGELFLMKLALHTFLSSGASARLTF